MGVRHRIKRVHKVEWQKPQPYVRLFGKWKAVEEREKEKYEELGFKIEYF